MQRKFLWWSLMIAIFSAAVTFCAYAGYHVYHYRKFDSRCEAQEVSWDVEQRGKDAFVVVATYRYKAYNREYGGKTFFEDNVYFNPWRADAAQKILAGGTLNVWYESRNPGKSTMNKVFPLKLCIYSGVLIVLFVYFVSLGWYVRSQAQ